MPKRIAPLSDTQISKAKAREKEYKLSDGYGLHLLVTPTGGKLWRMQYRFARQQKTLAIGAYPATSLADARKHREEAKQLLSQGVDPSKAKKSIKTGLEHHNASSFEAVAREWHKHHADAKTWCETHTAHKLATLEKDLFPRLSGRLVSEITTPELLRHLQDVMGRGALDAAHRLRFDCEKIFAYAIASGKAVNNPALQLRGILPPVKNGNYAAPTDPKELTPILKAIDGYTGSYVVRSALQLAPLLFLRPGELRMAEWCEFDFELAEWNIPAERMKMKIAHLVPLSKQAINILKALHPLTRHSKYVFPGQRSPLRCMSENAVNAALRIMGFERSVITGHGFRATARTILDEVLEVRTDFIEHQLAHVVKDANGTAYNRTKYLKQRQEMMQLWADYLDGLKK